MAAELTLAVAGVPGIFVSCVDCFRYVRLGQRFSQDFAFCSAKLEAAEIRLLRWGQPLGLLEGNERITLGDKYSKQKVDSACRWLKDIQTAFDDARKISEKYKVDRDEDELEMLNEEQELPKAEKPMRNLLKTLQKTCERRCEKMKRLPTQAKWALYKKDCFEDLLDQITTCVNNLVELFPANQIVLQQLCKEEISSLEPEGVLELVKVLENDKKKLNYTDDVELSKAAQQYVEAHRLEVRNVNMKTAGKATFGDDYGYQAGVKAGSIFANGIQFEGVGAQSEIRMGHKFEGRPPFS